jgi:single-stranded DNA-binding protein
MEKIVGHVVAQARTKEFESGKQVVNFQIAENRSVPDGDGGYKQAVRFFECSYWNGPGVAVHLVKGKLVSVEGVIGVRAYINSHNGEAIGMLTLQAQRIQLYGGAAKRDAAAPTSSSASNETITDDTPF